MTNCISRVAMTATINSNLGSVITLSGATQLLDITSKSLGFNKCKQLYHKPWCWHQQKHTVGRVMCLVMGSKPLEQ